MQKRLTSLVAICTLLTASLSFSKETNLFLAAQRNNISGLKSSLNRGASINELNNENKTALDVAVEADNKKAARFLLKNGGRVAKEANAVRLKNTLKGRALGFFAAGFFLTPLMWIGSFVAVDHMLKVEVL